METAVEVTGPGSDDPTIENCLTRNLTSREIALIERWDALSADQSERGIATGWRETAGLIQSGVLERNPILRDSGHRVLDIGCGVGDGSYRIRETNPDVIGIEISGKMLAEAAKESPPFGGLVQYSLTGDRELSDVGIENGSISGIVGLGVGHSLFARGMEPGQFDEAAALRFFQRMHALLEREGVMSFTFIPTSKTEYHALTTPLDPSTVRKLFEQAGFAVTVDGSGAAYEHDQGLGSVDYWILEGIKK